MVNPFTKKEIENDLRDLRETSFYGFYKRPLGQLLLGILPTEEYFKPDKIKNEIKVKEAGYPPKKIKVLEHLLLGPSKILCRLSADSDRKIRKIIKSTQNALLMGCIGPSSINALASKLSKTGFKGKIEVVEKEPNISKMLRHNLEKYLNITTKIKTADVLEYKNKNRCLIFCDVLGYYLTEEELDLKIPKFFSQFEKGSLAFICDLNETDYNDDNSVRTCGLNNKLDKYEILFKKWLIKHGLHITNKEILEIRKRLFERNDEKPKRIGLLQRYVRNLKDYKLITSSTFTAKGYVNNGLPTRYFDYMIFEKAY